MDEIPTNYMLEQFANYILFGKDERHISAVDEKIITQPSRAYSAWKTKAEKEKSLDAILDDAIKGPLLENEISHEFVRYRAPAPHIDRSTYDENGNILTYGDDWQRCPDGTMRPIQEMRELWQTIDYYEHLYAMYTGKEEADEYVLTHPKDHTALWRLRHLIIEIRRTQYYIKDAYNPAITCFQSPHAEKTPYDFNHDTGYWLEPEEWCRRRRTTPNHGQPPIERAPEKDGLLWWRVSGNAIDYEKPEHMAALMKNYASLLLHSYSNPDSPARILCYDFERYAGSDEAELTDEEWRIMSLAIGHKHDFQIAALLKKEGYEVDSEYRIANIRKIVLPKKLALAAVRLREEDEAAHGQLAQKRCQKCKNMWPATSNFFNVNKAKADGLGTKCKFCQHMEQTKIKEKMKQWNQAKSIESAQNANRTEDKVNT